MTETGDLDLELAEIRRRRIQELIERRAAPAPPSKPPSTTPVELDTSSISPFLTANPRVVVDVWAPWCAPCRTMAPVLEGLAARLFPQVRFAKVNADQEPRWTTQWGISGIPTLLLFEQGRVVDRIVGAYPGDVVEGRIRAAFRIRPGRAADPEDA